MSVHKFKPETTNGGNCFSDCLCGWSGGVYPTRPEARAAWQAHVDGKPGPAPIRPVLQIADIPRACDLCRGMPDHTPTCPTRMPGDQR